ncbi:MAG TPA: AAA family ATPase [Nitrososphaerales archaeon]|nr:AAA family ATPase [Nitrososphaerales archaeon]
MSVVAAKELEDDAKKYASEAIRLDSQGAHGMAIQMYQKAISTLVKLVHLYPDYRLNKQYTERAMAYQERVKAIQAAHGLLPRDEPTEMDMPTESAGGAGQSSVPQGSKGPQVVQQLKASFADLVVTEKPDVKWDDVVGLEDCKQAIRESIVFPFLRPDLFKLGWPRGILLFGPPGCYDEQTEILTKQGWKKYTELADDEVVATLNPDTNELEYHAIERKIQYHYDGKMYHLESTQVSLLVTPNHKLWVGKKAKHGEVNYSFAYPHEVFPRSKTNHPYYKKDAKWKGTDVDYIVLPQRESGSGPRHEEIRIPMSEWAPFFGLWLAEGYTAYSGGNYHVGIRNFDQEILRFAYDSLKKWGLNPHYSSDGRVSVLNKQLYELLRPIGDKYTKYIPDEMKNLPPDLLHSIIEYFARGDGTHEDADAEVGATRVRCQTSSPRLRDDLMEISLKAGLECNYVVHVLPGSTATIIEADGRERTITRTATNYRLSILYGRGETQVQKPNVEEWEDYSGTVWCVTVPNHVVYVRRAGKPVWCGNCGKTMIAAATAAEVDGYFISVDAASIMSKWLGEGERNVSKLFANARKMLANNKPVIIFVDEIDSLLGTRSQEVGGEVRVRDQFLKETDGLSDKGKNLHLYVIGATNKPWALDPPFLRRFSRRILVPLPDSSARMSQFRSYTSPLTLDNDVSVEGFARISEGFSGSDIKDICQAAQLKVVRELFESGKALDKDVQPRPIGMADFKEVMRSRRPSVSAEMLRAYTQWSDSFKAV